MISDFFKLLRVRQWYKNIVIFIPLIFSLNLFNYPQLFRISLGFFVLCLVSSSYYIINDYIDAKRDRTHPEKKNRPLASGKFAKSALFISVFLFIISAIISYFLSLSFYYAIISLFLLANLYTFKLKYIPFVDVIVISLNFVIKAVSGVFILNVSFSPWIVLCTFFLSVFLVTGKRKAEKINLKSNSRDYNPTLESYSDPLINIILALSVAVLIVFFSLYSIILARENLLFSIPIALYILIEYLKKVYKGDIIARNPEKMFLDKSIMFPLILWILVILLALYF